ncbi:recombinase family protein [uncultured Sphingomonas sp.]|uniref:recombinase family protein n=1 Tax=uncultured Sphingomonas sp. TaxID=158754 RepID=UPI0026097A2E|nr:recombinase family protein [uncultured Sphingomonas sp.]
MIKTGLGRARLRAVGYVRVSTKRQAEHQISLAEQEKRIRAWASTQGYELLEVYREPGASARSDRRPVFRRMIADAEAQPTPFDVVLIYNFSRFFRDDFDFERYRRQLEESRVRLESVTQQVAEGPSGKLARGVTTLVDAYQSDVNAEQVKMAMAANAASGFWNGSTPPFGYETFVAGRMAKKDKKQLRIYEEEAAVVRLIFDLYLERCGNYGKSGVIAITHELNRRGLLIRGKPFRTATVHLILHRETYAGTHYYNQVDSRTRQKRPREEWIAVEVPPIVSSADFAKAQAKLARHHPKVTAPRTANAPTLTAGIAKCGAEGCGAGMILRTGKGGSYRYLICGHKRTIDLAACSSTPVRMDVVDNIVIEALAERILAPERLRLLLESVLDRSDAALAERREALKARRAEKSKVEGQKMRLLELVELGELGTHDPQLRQRLQNHNARLANLAVEIRSLEQQLAMPRRNITPTILDRFAAVVREGLRDEDPMLRKAYVRLLADEIVVTSESVLIRGSRQALEHAIFGGTDASDGVLTFIQDWRTRQDSNLWPLPSEQFSLPILNARQGTLQCDM